MRRPPRLLIVSPIASHPADQGNAARIQSLGGALMARGIACEFLCFATEGLAPSQQAAMAGFWHALHVEPGVVTGESSMPGCWGLDDWCPPALVERVAGLQRARRYDAVLVNYVWLSAALAGSGEPCASSIPTTSSVAATRWPATRGSIPPGSSPASRKSPAASTGPSWCSASRPRRRRCCADAVRWRLRCSATCRRCASSAPRPRRRPCPSATLAAPIPGTSPPCAPWMPPWRQRRSCPGYSPAASCAGRTCCSPRARGCCRSSPMPPPSMPRSIAC
ncbi:hypothetical protein ACFQY5_04125 [Paeniroseomonas aquatica]|uniref:hypothetical protein n=1 Tax=Paeniroseomonas aquatica TaxID=373043 RepID=UPI0036149549